MALLAFEKGVVERVSPLCAVTCQHQLAFGKFAATSLRSQLGQEDGVAASIGDGIDGKNGIDDFCDFHFSHKAHVFGNRVATTASIVRELVAVV